MPGQGDSGHRPTREHQAPRHSTFGKGLIHWLPQMSAYPRPAVTTPSPLPDDLLEVLRVHSSNPAIAKKTRSDSLVHIFAKINDCKAPATYQHHSDSDYVGSLDRPHSCAWVLQQTYKTRGDCQTPR